MSVLRKITALCILTALAATACGDSVVTIPGDPSADADQGGVGDMGSPYTQDDMKPLLDFGTPRPSDMDTPTPVDMGSPPDPPDMRMEPVDMGPPPPPEDMGTPDPPDMNMEPEDMAPPRPPGPAPSDSVETVKNQGCTTAVVKGLSQQLIDEMNCISPGVVSGIDHIAALDLYSVVFPYMQTPAANSLTARMSSRAAGSVRVSSALRTLPQQYLLYRWYREGRCNIGLAATPGNSNHNGALAIDTPDYNAIKSDMTGNGWRWLGNSDPVHFDYTAGGMDIRSLSVLAFQKLWNRNNPNDTIAEDGAYGPQTEGKLKLAPSNGFSIVPWCPGTSVRPLSGVASATFLLDGGWASVLAPAIVRHVEYRVDGEVVATASRDDDGAWANFMVDFQPTLDGMKGEKRGGHQPVLEVDLIGPEGEILRTMQGLMEGKDGIAILPDGPGLYRVSARGYEDDAFIEVYRDGKLILPDPTAPWTPTSGVYGLGREVSLERVEVRVRR